MTGPVTATTGDTGAQRPPVPGSHPAGGRPVVPSRGRLRPLGFEEVRLTHGFWARLQETNTTATLEHCLSWIERAGWLANFDRVAQGTTGPGRPGWSFSDSEVYKLLEALAWEVGRTRNAWAENQFRRLTARIARAQDADGYLNTCFGHNDRPVRYSDLEMGHELYCTGHLLQAAVARLRTSGRDQLVDVAIRAADHVCRTFGEDAHPGICGHPEIELGLAELGRALGEARYLDQARIFLDRRGHGTLADIPLGRAYFQDDMPIRDAEVWRGHAVRALYLSAAAVDVAVELGDHELLSAVRRQWERTVARRTYLTGGMGSRHQDEGFGEDWELPPDRAYCETCAGIASVMVSWRLYLATGDVRYADLIERTLYNVVAASPRSDGRAFFYTNPLQQRTAGRPPNEDAVHPRAEGAARAAWFDVSCCPTNVARTLASLDGYLATADAEGLQLHLYASSQIRTTLGDGREIGVDVDTDYPTDGLVTARVVGAGAATWTLTLRVPPWASGAALGINGSSQRVDRGLVSLAVRAGDVVTLELPVTPRFTSPDPRIDAVRGCVAVERGPEVLCVESVDVGADDLDDLQVDTDMAPEERNGTVHVRARVVRRAHEPWPYGLGTTEPPATDEPQDLVDVPLRPYRSWAESGPSTMRVWLPAGQSPGSRV